MPQFRMFVRKEFFHIFRDRRSMLILIAMPIIMIILFGYAVTTEVKDTRLAVLDISKDEQTSKIIERFSGNRYFTLTAYVGTYDEIQSLFRRGEIDMAIVFDENFAGEMLHSGHVSVQLLADGSEPNQASVRTGYAQNILNDYAADYVTKHGYKPRCRIVPVVKMLYNPQGRSEYNFVPGVIGMILMLICAMMTSISIVRERETGTMEVLLASPLSPIVIVLAKLVPFFIISCANVATILLISMVLLGIPIAGSLVGFIVLTLIYIIVALLLGLLISTIVDSQLAAMLLSLILIVPTVYLSGLAFPIESMPTALQNVSAIFPARWYVSVARKLMIQGVEMRYVVKEAVILVFTACVLLFAAMKMFKTRLE